MTDVFGKPYPAWVIPYFRASYSVVPQPHFAEARGYPNAWEIGPLGGGLHSTVYVQRTEMTNGTVRIMVWGKGPVSRAYAEEIKVHVNNHPRHFPAHEWTSAMADQRTRLLNREERMAGLSPGDSADLAELNKAFQFEQTRLRNTNLRGG